MSVGLTVEGVSLSFGAVQALSDVSLTAEAGQVHGVIGPNGAGKSSVFNVISGVYRPSQGSVRLGGRELVGLRPHRVAATGVGRSFQNVDLSGDETVLESLLAGRDHLMHASVVSAMFGLPRSRREERRHTDRAHEIAAFCGIDGVLGHRLRDLPYGLRKLVDVARAVCMEPSVLLLDEPAAGLDPAETWQVGTLIRDLRRALDLTVLLIEHDVGLVMTLSDRVTVLDFGRRIAHGTPEEIQSDPAVVAAYLGVGESAEDEITDARSEVDR